MFMILVKASRGEGHARPLYEVTGGVLIDLALTLLLQQNVDRKIRNLAT